MSTPQLRVEWLRREIEGHNEAYYSKDAPLIPDADYDELVRELRSLEARYPQLADTSSVSTKVGVGSTTVFQAVTHAEPMLSLDNVFDEHELRDWSERVARGLGTDAQPVEFVVEPKIDGLALSITYVDGVLRQAATRGDGRVGEDVPYRTGGRSAPRRRTRSSWLAVRLPRALWRWWCRALARGPAGRLPGWPPWPGRSSTAERPPGGAI